LLGRLLDSLRNQGPSLREVVVVNNGGDAESADVARARSPVPVRILEPAANLGTAGGLALAFGATESTTTHFWVLDDDAIALPGALDEMLQAWSRTGAAAVAPLMPNAAGRIQWFPGPLPQPAWDWIRRDVTPEEFVQRCGLAPLPFNWAIWASLLIDRRAAQEVGWPDARLWFQATDIEYTLRLSARYPCVLAPAAVCPHLPPEQRDERRFQKELWSLQNNWFIATRLPHGRRILRHQPGNVYRYWKRRHFAPLGLIEAMFACWRGAILGRPVGLEQKARDLSPDRASS
jgi:GT2 family glycosyltransferase